MSSSHGDNLSGVLFSILAWFGNGSYRFGLT
jgi:hypothetical protein